MCMHILAQLRAGTLVQLLDLECPVEDEKGYVYEKAAIIDYLRKEQRVGRGVAACPVAGGLSRPPALSDSC